MKATVIFEDGVIIVDDVVVHIEPFAPPEDNWRVIQWNGDDGCIEVHYGERIWLSEPSSLDPYLAMHFVALSNELVVEPT